MEVDKWNKSIIQILNTFDGWDLRYVGDSTVTALGKTPKGFRCVLNIHFDTLQPQPYIFEETWRDFKEMADDIAWVYMYVSKDANYFYWLNITNPVRTDGRLILKKEDAQIINYHD